MKSLAYLSIIILAVLFTVLPIRAIAQEEPQDNYEPIIWPMGLADPNYKIIKEIVSPDGQTTVHIVAPASLKNEAQICGGINFDCFMFVNGDLVESIPFLAAFYRPPESLIFGLNGLWLKTFRFHESNLIVFEAVFGDAQFWASDTYCLNPNTLELEKLKSETAKGSLESDDVEETLSYNFDSFCAPKLLAPKTFFSFASRPY